MAVAARVRSLVLFVAFVLGASGGTTTSEAALFTYDVQTNDRVAVHEFGDVDAGAAHLSGRSVSSDVEGRGTSTTSPHGFIATNSAGAIEEASNAAFKAADNVGDFTLSAKHLPGAGGNWNRFAAGVDPDAAIAQALRSPSARFLPNGEGTFKVVTDLGFQVGEKASQTGVRAVVTTDGRIITAFPVKP